jgi:hypothetical protein
MENIEMLLRNIAVLVSFVFISISAFAEPLTFKGIAFGMKAAEIANLGGGDLKFGCASAIAEKENPWTYGGIDGWTASCVEGQNEASRIPGTSGMYQLTSLVSSHKNGLAKMVGKKTYSVDELVTIFSKIFGKFDIKTRVVKNGLGQEFVKKEATAMRDGAAMHIADDTSGSNHEDYIHLKITSLDYVAKKSAWESKQNTKKLKDAMSDF